MNNLKQIGMAVVQYVQDSDEKYPGYQHVITTASSSYEGYNANTLFMTRSTVPATYTYSVLWPRNMQPYLKSLQVFSCPSSSIPLSTDRGRKGNYGSNLAIFSPDGYEVVPVSAMVAPASTYMVMDGGTLYMFPLYAYTARSESYLPGSAPYARVSPTPIASNFVPDFEQGRHFYGVNVLFADGHVKWMRSEVLVREAEKCASSSCMDGATKGYQSAWNPLVPQ